MNNHKASRQEEATSTPADQILALLQNVLALVSTDPQCLPLPEDADVLLSCLTIIVLLAMLVALLQGSAALLASGDSSPGLG